MPLDAPDRINGLQDEDWIDLSGIDANTDLEGDQAFVRVEAFTGAAGELTAVYRMYWSTSFLMDVDGDGQADGVIQTYDDHTGFANFVL